MMLTSAFLRCSPQDLWSLCLRLSGNRRNPQRQRPGGLTLSCRVEKRQKNVHVQGLVSFHQTSLLRTTRAPALGCITDCPCMPSHRHLIAMPVTVQSAVLNSPLVPLVHLPSEGAARSTGPPFPSSHVHPDKALPCDENWSAPCVLHLCMLVSHSSSRHHVECCLLHHVCSKDSRRLRLFTSGLNQTHYFCLTPGHHVLDARSSRSRCPSPTW